VTPHIRIEAHDQSWFNLAFQWCGYRGLFGISGFKFVQYD